MDPHANNSVQLTKSSLGCVDGGTAWATAGAQDRIILISNSVNLVTMMSLPQVISSLSLSLRLPSQPFSFLNSYFLSVIKILNVDLSGLGIPILFYSPILLPVFWALGLQA